MQAFITPSGPFDNPVSHFRTALLTVTMALAVVFCLLLLTAQPELDVIMIDIGGPADGPPTVPPPLHQLVIDRDGRITMDGTRVANHVQLRRIIDAQQLEDPVPDLQVEPHPDARYEDFIDALYVIKRAHVDQVCFDWDPPEQRAALAAAAKRPCTISFPTLPQQP